MRAFAGVAEVSRAELLEAPVHWPRPSALDVSLEIFQGVGPRLAETAAAAGLRTVGDVLQRFPHSHRDRRVRPLGEVGEGETATVLVEVLRPTGRAFRRRGLSMVTVKVGDDSGSTRATWFNQPWMAEKLAAGTRVLVTGKLSKRGLSVSEYEIVAAGGAREDVAGDAATGLMPVHPASEDLPPKRIREWAEQAVRWAPNAIEGLPAQLRVRRGLAAAADAICAAHFPSSEQQLGEARRRLAYEELFLHQALLAVRRRTRRATRPAPRLGSPGELVGSWLDSLPFEPTAAQLAAFDEVDADLDSGEPMQRLLMGEVGSGKTVVAVYAMLRAREAGFQAALMAPTETLAEQHAVTLDRLLAAEAIPFALLTGSTPAASRERALNQLASGELGLILGTHALIEPTVAFARLGLVVVDEQHRFGVAQRQALDGKGVGGMAPHLLHMTATPIPRTLSLTAYGDLDTTALRELPAGRQPIETRLVTEDDRPAAYEFVRARLREGRQAFVVCPLVAESEKQRGKAAEVEAARLAAGELNGFAIGVLHGQMPSARKAEAMEAFAAGETEVLVATTVVEVGIDVPNATVMVIEGAERFGVSQLHQLRGRVGRGAHASHCLLFAESSGETARRRLGAVAGESDGFKLAEIDLALRGEGEILGTRQHGLPRFAVAELPEDGEMLKLARDDMLQLMRSHGTLSDPALGPLLDAARRRFGADAADPIPL